MFRDCEVRCVCRCRDPREKEGRTLEGLFYLYLMRLCGEKVKGLAGGSWLRAGFFLLLGWAGLVPMICLVVEWCGIFPW